MYPIRILHVVATMNRGGLETLLMNIYRNIDRSKVQFDFLVHFKEKGMYEDEIKKLGGKVYRIEHITKAGPIKYKKQLKNFFKNNKYNIVHSHMDAMSGIVLREVKKNGVPVRIAHSHNSYPKMRLFEKIYKNYSKLFINSSCTDKFACSNIAGEWLFGENIDNKSFTVLKNAIDTNKFKFNNLIRKNVREQLGISEDTLVIGNIARFNTQKNHDFLIDIFEEVKKLEKNTKLVLVGDGNLKQSIEEKVHRLGLDQDVLFLGVREDIPNLLNAFDIFLFPSLHEGLGIVLIEAQSNGLKCIVSKAVPEEADIKCNLLNIISLSQSAKVWANKIIEERYYNRESEISIKLANDSGYDIYEVSKWIESYYINKECNIG